MNKEQLETRIEQLKETIEQKEEEIENFELDPDNYEEEYIEMLDSEGTITAGGIDFDPSRVLKELDPTAFYCGLNDWIDSLDKEDDENYKELLEELERLEEELEELQAELEELEEEENN
jgi:chromosome segregation ATPase